MSGCSPAGFYGLEATLERLRSACAPESTIDVDRHAQTVAGLVSDARERGRDELLRERLNVELHRREWR